MIIGFTRTAFAEFLVLSGLYAVMVLSEGIHCSAAVYWTNAVIVVYSLASLLRRSDRSYSARKFFFLFVLFFMGIAPLMQFKMGVEAVGGYTIEEGTYVRVNAMIIGVMALFEAVYFYSYHHIGRPLMRPSEGVVAVGESRRRRWRLTLLGISVACVAATVIYFIDEPIRLLVRTLECDNHGYDGQLRTGGTYLKLLMEWIVRPLPAVCCLVYWIMGRSRGWKVVFLVLMLVTCFPTAIERLRTATYYIALLIVAFPGLRYGNRFVNVFLGGILVVFPWLNNFRRWGTEGAEWYHVDFSMLWDINFDSYQSLAFAVQNHFIDFAGQAQEFLLFWIPRFFWPDKPQMSGYRMAKEFDLSYDFIAMNFWGEGYIMAGYAGVALFTVGAAWILAKVDKTYWHFYDGMPRSLFAGLFLLLISLEFYCLRGDLAGGLITTLSLLALYYGVGRLTYGFLGSNRA